MPTALVYIRRSEVRSNKPTLSPQRQQDSCVSFCQEKGWHTEVYADAQGHRSGRSEKNRPEWLRLKERIRYAEPGQITAVVVYSLDRSARSTRDFLNFLHLLQEKQADFVSVTQPFLDTTSAVGRAFMSMLSIWAQLEADMDSERVRADMAYRQEQGLFVGHCPIGYKRQQVNGYKVPMPNADAPRVVQIWEEYATGNYSYRSLAKWINNVLQLPTQGGGPWTHKHVQIMFDNHLFYRGWVTRYRKKGGAEKYEGKHPGIISDELAAKALQVRGQKESPQLRQRRPPKYSYLLTPILFCATCGRSMRAAPNRNKPYYKHTGQGCTWNLVRADKVEQAVLTAFQGWTLPAQFEQAVESACREQLARQQMGEDDHAKVQELEQRKERSLRLFQLGMRDEAWLVSTMGELDQAIAELTPAVSLPYNPHELGELMRQLTVIIQDSNTPTDVTRGVLARIFERIDTNDEAEIRFQPRHWFRQFFTDCLGDKLYPQGNLGAQYVAFRQGIAGLMAVK